MFDVANIGGAIVETIINGIIIDDIHKTYDLSSDNRSRKIKIDTYIDLKNAAFEINLNYRSEPRVIAGEGLK